MHHSYMYVTCVLRAAEEKSPPHLSLSDCTSVTLPPIVHAHTRAPLMHVWNAHVQMHPARSKQLTLSFCSDHIVHEHSFTPLRLVSAFVSSFCTHTCTHARTTPHIHAYVQHAHPHFLTLSPSVSFWIRPNILCRTFVCVTVYLIVTELATV